MDPFDSEWHNSGTNLIFNESFRDRFDNVTICVDFHLKKVIKKSFFSDQICSCTRGSWIGTPHQRLMWHVSIVNDETWRTN